MDYLLICLLGLGYLAMSPVHGAYTVSDAKTLYTALTFDYNVNVRPSETVNISVTLTLDSINHLDFDKQTFSVDGWITSVWEDPSFTWTPSSFGNIEYLFLTKANCWKPSMIIDNELSYKDVLNDDNLPMRVKYDNKVTWEQPHVFTVYCNLDSALFPFDKQTCSISIGTATYDMTEVLLVHGGSDVITSSIDDNSEWSVEDTSVTTKVRMDTSGLSFTNLIFSVDIKRNGVWYAINLLVPWIVTSFLGLAVFWIPVQCGEKIAYTSTVLVVNAILLGISAYFLPTSVVSAPVLGGYMVSNLILNAVEVVLTIISIRIHNRQTGVKAVPITTQALVRKFSFRGNDGQTQEIIDLTSDDKKRSNTLKKKFSMKGQNKIGPSPMATPAGYQRMESGTDSNPSVDPELDGRTNVPSNSRYRPSSYTHIRPPSQAQERPSSYTHTRPPSQLHDRPSSYTRPMSWKSTAGIQIREKSFVNEDLRNGYVNGLDQPSNIEPEHVLRDSGVSDVNSSNHLRREPAGNDVVSANTLTNENVINNVASGTSGVDNNTGHGLQKKPSESSNRQGPAKGISFRPRGRDENGVTWTEVAHLFDILCFIVMFILVFVLTVVIFAIFMFK